MKTRESGMPDEDTWGRFFNPNDVLKRMGLESVVGDVVDFGCGYGTFSIPSAKMIKGKVYAIDIEDEMIQSVRKKVEEMALSNVIVDKRDFIEKGSEFPNESMGYVMLFNILHAEEPRRLTDEAYRILKVGGLVGVIHWKHDSSTPRGPSMEIRPKPEQCRKWLLTSGFNLKEDLIELPPYHYGIIGIKPYHPT